MSKFTLTISKSAMVSAVHGGYMRRSLWSRRRNPSDTVNAFLESRKRRAVESHRKWRHRVNARPSEDAASEFGHTHCLLEFWALFSRGALWAFISVSVELYSVFLAKRHPEHKIQDEYSFGLRWGNDSLQTAVVRVSARLYLANPLIGVNVQLDTTVQHRKVFS